MTKFEWRMWDDTSEQMGHSVAILHERYQDDGDQPDGDVWVQVYLPRFDDAGFNQMETLFRLLKLIAPDGVLPPLGDIILNIMNEAEAMLTDIAAGKV